MHGTMSLKFSTVLYCSAFNDLTFLVYLVFFSLIHDTT